MPSTKRIPAGQRTAFLNVTDTEEEQRWCPRCEAHRPMSEFYGATKAHVSYCKAHWLEYQAQYDTPRKQQDRSLRKNYGITVDQYEAMLAAQGGVCAVCGRPETHRHTRGQDRPCYLAVDHDHATGEVRALLCYQCNVSLGALQEDPARIRALLAYAERIQQDRAA